MLKIYPFTEAVIVWGNLKTDKLVQSPCVIVGSPEFFDFYTTSHTEKKKKVQADENYCNPV